MYDVDEPIIVNCNENARTILQLTVALLLTVGYKDIMQKTKVLNYYLNDVQAIAEDLDIHVSAVYQWGERIPELRARQLDEITGGKLKFVASHYHGS